MRFVSNLIFCLASVGACLSLSGCPEKGGPAEKAGEKIDTAAKTVSEGAKTAADKVGEGAKTAASKVGGAVKKAGEKIENAAQ